MGVIVKTSKNATDMATKLKLPDVHGKGAGLSQQGNENLT